MHEQARKIKMNKVQKNLKRKMGECALHLADQAFIETPQSLFIVDINYLCWGAPVCILCEIHQQILAWFKLFLIFLKFTFYV